MRWLRRVVATDTESTGRVSGNLDEDDGLTPKQQQENEWARAGWIAVWEPTAGSPSGRRRQYWARQGADGVVRVFPGIGAPPVGDGEAHFYVNGDRAYCDDGHPDGPSSIPCFRVRRGRVRPAEGFPGGASDRPLFHVRILRANGVGVTIRHNPLAKPGE